jgi:hypothetical protein
MTLAAKPPQTVRVSDNWLKDILRSSSASEDSQIVARARQDSLCVLCKGSRMLCGKTRCSIMVKVNYYLKSVPLMANEDIAGMSPPSVFIGRIGYPNVYAGPLVPPVHEDTSIFDLPERWFGKSIDEIVGFRSLLVRGKYRVNVNNFKTAGKIIDATRELAWN